MTKDASGETTDTDSVQRPRAVSKPEATASQPSDETDEFGLKIHSAKTRLYELPPVEDGEKDGSASKEDSDEEEGSAAFRTPDNEREDPSPGGRSDPAGGVEGSSRASDAVKVEQDNEAHREALHLDTRPVPGQDYPQVKVAEEEVKSRPTSLAIPSSPEARRGQVSEWSHMQLAPKQEEEMIIDEGEWQTMPAYATHTIYDDWGKVLAKEEAELEQVEAAGYNNLGGAGKGYTKVQLDDDAKSATSMDDDTAYLFKQGKTTTLLEEDEEGRDMLGQMQATKDLLTEGQRIAYVAVVKIVTMDMYRQLEKMERTRWTKKHLESTKEALKKWSQKIMVRLYGHMEISSDEQVMIEQLAEHGVEAGDLTPPLMQNARVKNPVTAEEEQRVDGGNASAAASNENLEVKPVISQPPTPSTPGTALAPYDEDIAPGDMAIKDPTDLVGQKKLDIDLRWTVLCDLFLVLVADSNYDSRSRTLLEGVGKALSVEWLDICRFEKRITDALEMQEAADKENWNEEEHMEQREKSSRNRKLIMMGLATVGGGLVIGLSAGLLAPVIGAGFAAGFTTIGVAGTSTFFGGAGAAALITSTGVVTGGTIGVRASHRRMGAVKTFEYRPLHNNKRVNLIVTVAGWMTGKVDDVRLPFSTVDPIMGDMYSILWEPEMLQSMGQTINILATEALTQGLQQILGSTILIALMAALQLPVLLTKLAYLIDNPWNVSLARADQAGLILADSLIDRNLGSRPITLCGFSIGSRVIFSCLKELAKKNAHGLVQNVYLYGSPMVVNKDDYLRARSMVSGRFLNGYATNDWILGYLFRATSGGIMRVAGLAPVEIEGIENVNVTEHVPGHMSYRTAMPKLLQEAGWAVESLEFNEIEDPDPENHEKRQRQLINEIEEARKKLEEKPSKKGLRALFTRNKKASEKKEWETYDERAKAPNGHDPEAPIVDDGNPVLFDIDAITREVAELSAQGIEIKEIKSTLPPMKLSVANDTTPISPPYDRSYSSRSSLSDISAPAPVSRSQTFNGGALSHKTSTSSLNGRDRTSADAPRNGYLSPASPPPPLMTTAAARKGSWWRGGSKDDVRSYSSEAVGDGHKRSGSGTSSPGLSPGAQNGDVRPGLKTVQTAPVLGGAAVGVGVGVGAGIAGNAWADEDEFGHGGEEGEMTFE